jgi:hypothetical protein
LQDLSLLGHHKVFAANPEAELLKITALAALKSLNIGGCRVTSIACLATLTSLRKLEMAECNETCICQLPTLVELKEVNLRNCVFGDGSWTALTSCSNLTRLCLSFCAGVQGVKLSKLSVMLSLQHLEMTFMSKMDENRGVAAFTRELTKLTVLDMGACLQLSHNSLKNMSCLQQLQHLSLEDCPNIRWNLHRVASLTALRSLNLNNCRDAGVTANYPIIMGLANLPHLTRLFLPPLYDGGVPFSLHGFTSLKVLGANFSRIDMLTGLPTLNRLMWVSLRDCNVTDAHLTQLTSLTRLKFINLTGNGGVTAAGRSSLLHLGCAR